MKHKLILLFKPIVESFPKFASIYRQIRDNLKLLEEPQDMPLCFKLAGHPVMKYGTFETEERELVKNCCQFWLSLKSWVRILGIIAVLRYQ